MVKQYYKIGEVAKMLGLKSSVLRFWETEFPQLKPTKSPSGQRYYTPKHLDIIKSIHKMLHIDKFTIIGAKQILADKDARENIIIDIRTAEEKHQEELTRTIGIDKLELIAELKLIKTTLERTF